MGEWPKPAKWVGAVEDKVELMRPCSGLCKGGWPRVREASGVLKSAILDQDASGQGLE